MEIIIRGDSVDAIAKEVGMLAARFGVTGLDRQLDLPLPSSRNATIQSNGGATAAGPATPAPNPRGRPRKTVNLTVEDARAAQAEETSAHDISSLKQETETNPFEDEAPSVSAAVAIMSKAELTELAREKGIPATKAALEKMGLKKMSELAEAQYPKFAKLISA